MKRPLTLMTLRSSCFPTWQTFITILGRLFSASRWGGMPSTPLKTSLFSPLTIHHHTSTTALQQANSGSRRWPRCTFVMR